MILAIEIHSDAVKRVYIRLSRQGLMGIAGYAPTFPRCDPTLAFRIYHHSWVSPSRLPGV